MSTEPKLKDAALTLQERVAMLTLQRDDVRNALTGTHLIEDIVNTVEWVNRNSDVPVLIITRPLMPSWPGGNSTQVTGYPCSPDETQWNPGRVFPDYAYAPSGLRAYRYPYPGFFSVTPCEAILSCRFLGNGLA